MFEHQHLPEETWEHGAWPDPTSHLFVWMLGSFLARLLLTTSLLVCSIFWSIFGGGPLSDSESTGSGVLDRNRLSRASMASLQNGDARSATGPPGTGTGGSTASSSNEKYKLPTTFSEFFHHFRRLYPYVWPHGKENRRLQLMISACLLMLVLGRVVNVLVPIQYKRVVTALEEYALSNSDFLLEKVMKLRGLTVMLSSEDGRTVSGSKGGGDYGKIPYVELLSFVFLRFLQGSAGLLSTVQNYFWIPVGQFTTREVSIGMFNHLHKLSHRFHMNRKTGEILRVQDRGVASIVSILSSVFFQIVPCLVDILVSVTYFAIEFDVYFGLIVFLTMALYIVVTITMTEWRTAYRRAANALDNAMEARAVDSLLNFETVKLYTAESFEEKMYKEAVAEYQKADFASSMSQSTLNMAQSLIIQFGLLVGCLLCAKRIVVDETMQIGDFVLYLTYITQLYGPLNWFGNYYRVIQKNFVDMEKMLDLLEEDIEIKDSENARPIEVRGGEVVFENVSFQYDTRGSLILDDISFKIPAGATVALVGPSGGGKSTILRLIMRFYDVLKGRVLIDGQDVRNVQLKSLRMVVGVVPQDTVLFNETVLYNIQYGRPDSSSEDEVVEAAMAAQIHDRIISFPDGYDTKVGERGLRLSGGEKQRVAIARTFVKNPAIVLLDEATSALDNTTERQVQESLRTLRHNKTTTIVIAHRLSTVVEADLILVVEHGRVVERGRHKELLQSGNGVYYRMWIDQQERELASVEY
ncbi:Homocysteine S-methyltransferase 1 [Phlyctochytrium planicorne]|nr:Homocysteine S-methyltransferase 1 [Phlyctochytrium planicorne]